MRRLALPLLLLLAGCMSYSKIDAGGGTSAPGLSLNVTRIDEVDGDLYVILELRNDSTQPFEYASDGPGPETDVQLLTDAAWVYAFTIRSCTPPEILTLAPGERVQAKAYVDGDNRHRRVRVGVRRGEYGKVAVWSPVIDLATKKWGVKRDFASR